MTIRTLSTTLKNSLMNYEPFIVAHLIKFERPVSVAQYGGESQGIATDYTYITDAQYDIEYQDGTTPFNSDIPHPPQKYRANKILKLGTINESVQAKASSMSLSFDTASLGSTATISATFTGVAMTTDVDLASAGFQEGDKILLSGTNNTNDGTYIRIDSFQNEGKTVTFTQISSIQATATAETYSVTLVSEELNSLITDKESASYTNYINREVLIYKVHINPETRAIIGEPYLYFKGITSGASIQEKLDSSEVVWTLSSHWGDFIRVQGRLTDDATHRALRSDGSPDLTAVTRKAYAGDLGFIHANTALNHVATYNTTEIEYKQVDINGGWPGGKRLREVEVTVPRQTDLQFNIQSKMLPVVYGVRKIDSFPIFVDTDKNSSATVYRADAICEGKIAGILDIHIEGNSTICLDKADFDSRARTGSNYDAGTVEVVCSGRMDRGDTLAHYSAQAGNAINWFAIGETDLSVTRLELETNPEYWNPYYEGAYSGTNTGTDSGSGGAATGILHEGTYSITNPLRANFTFHQGLENQDANNTLVSTAAAQNFKIQDSYYSGKAQYWSPSHQLLDTAYVVGKYTIAEGETTLPELEFVVRGRDPECYNYDYSYKFDSSAAGQSTGAVSDFSLGDSVVLKKTNGNMPDSVVTIIDKWSTYDSDGNSDHRFRFSIAPDLGTTTSFYMQKGALTWSMQTWDHFSNAGAPAGDLFHASFIEEAGTTNGRKFTLTSPSTIIDNTFNQDKAIIGLYKTDSQALLASSYSNLSYNANANVLDNVGAFGSSVSPDRLYVKNGIQLQSDASIENNAYVGAKITLVHNTGSAPYVQERIIVAYNGTTKVALVDSPWDFNYMPSTLQTGGVSDYNYSVGSKGDKRVTINPAMQLLDYMTNKRYGKGLDTDKDIDISAWVKAARDCDTRSDVTVLLPYYGIPVSEGDVFKYPSTGPTQFIGTVKSSSIIETKKQVVFTDVVGKLGIKWNSWQSFDLGQLYWHEGKVYEGTGAVVSTAPTSGHITTLSLQQNDITPIAIDITLASANGNPIVKAYSPSSANFNASGYSLYDGDDVKYWRYVGWDDSAQRNVTRHQMNQVVDTKLPIFDNINKMLSQFNGILRYTNGKYQLEVKGKKGIIDIAEQITNEDIIGTIKLSDKGLKNSKNYLSTSIIDPNNKFEGRSVSFFNSDYLKEDKGIQKKGQYSLPGVTNYFNARFAIKQYLDESRYGLQIQFTMAPRGLLLVAGSIIEFTYPRFGYSSKLFRITNLNFKKDGTVDVTADEHNDNAYVVQESGNGLGVLDDPQGGQNPRSLPVPSRPLGLQATQTNQGEVVLSWSNTSSFSSATHETEVYRTTVNNFTDASREIIGTSTTNTFHDPITLGSGLQTRYYWIRYMVRTPRTNLAGSQFRNVPSLFYPNITDTNFEEGQGITGIGLSVNAVRTIKLNPGVTQTFVYQNDETGIETGYAASTNLTASKTNDAGTVTYVWKKNDVVIAGATEASYTYTPPDAFGSMPEKISIHMTDTVGSETFTATDSVSMSATKIVVNGSAGINGFTVTATAGTFVFPADSVGTINSVSNFSSIFKVLQGNTQLTYDEGVTPANNTYKLGSFSNVLPADSVTPINTNGTITIDALFGTFLSGTDVMQATFEVPVIENNGGATIATFKLSLTKLLSASDGAPGVKSSLVYAYQRSSIALTTNPGDVVVDLNSGLITTTTLANGWFKTIDGPSGSEALYIVAASAAGTGSTDTIADTEWTSPIILAENGIDADALTATVDTSVPGQTTITYSDGTTFTVDDGIDGDPGDTIGVAAIFASDAAGTTQSYDQGTNPYVNYYEYTGTKPTLPVVGLTFVKYIGTDGDSEGVIPIYADDAAGTNATFTYSSQAFVNFYEWTGTAPTEVPASLTYVKFVGSDGTDGDPGADAYTSATVFIYKKSNLTTETTKPEGDTTYTFSDGTLVFTTPNGWSSQVPPGTESYLWIRQATAFAPGSDTTDSIPATEWSDASLLAQSGVNGVRGGSVFNVDISDSGITAAIVADWSTDADSVLQASITAIATIVISSAQDGTIQPNDRITVTDSENNVAGTRVYTGGAQTVGSSCSPGDFSALVVETFAGSVIVDGTLSADKVAANATFSNNLKVASTLTLGTSTNPGVFHSVNKPEYTSTNAGFFLGATGEAPNITAYKLNLGDSTNYLKWNGASLTIAGTIEMTATSTIAGTTASTVVTGAAAGSTANQDSTPTILAGDHTGDVTGTVDGTAATTVVTGAAAGSQVAAQTSLLPRADDSEWVVGSSTFPQGIWYANETFGSGENTVVLEAGPHEDIVKVWKAVSTDGSDADGGFFNIGHGSFPDTSFAVESNTVYRFTFFVKQDNTNGQMYVGGWNYDASNLLTLSDYNGVNPTNNKYFIPGQDLPTQNEWYLFVGYFNPANTNINSSKGGLYKVSTGQKVTSVDDLRFHPSAIRFAVRAYQFYGTNTPTAITRWTHVRVDRLDRPFLSIQQLLNDTSVDTILSSTHTGDVTGNVTGTVDGTAAATVKAGAVAGSTANQDSTPTILAGDHSGPVGGTPNTTVATAHTTAGGASTGSSRAYMSNNGLVVVDGSGVTRVKIGNLALL